MISKKMINRPFIALTLIIIIHILLLANLQFIPWPENLTWPYFNLHGLQYYRNIFILYPPLYWWLLTGFFKFFGISIFHLQIYSYVIVALTDLLLWFVSGKKILALLIFVPLQIFFEGNGVWVDQLLAPAFLGAYFFLRSRKIFLLGLSLGIALLIKQTSVYFIIGMLFLIALQNSRRINISKYLLGIFIPVALVALYLENMGLLPYFYKEAIDYILFFHTKHTLQSQLPTIRQLLIVLVVYLPSIVVTIRKKKPVLLILLLASSLGVFTRFEYFHLQPALPFVAIALSLGLFEIFFYLVFVLIFIKFCISSWHLPPRFFDNNTVVNSQILSLLFPGGSKVLFINTWDQYYWLTKTLPVGRYFVPSTPWTMDYPGNQEMIVKNLNSQKPKYLVYNNCFSVKNICYEPGVLKKIIQSNYHQILKLTDGTSVFENNPVGVGEKIQP